MLELYEKGSEAAWLSSFSFGVDIRPRFCETDALGHVSKVSYPIYLEQSKLDYLRAVGDPEYYAFYHFRHVAAELRIRFVAPCYYDEPLRALTRMAQLGRSSGLVEHAIVDVEGHVRLVAQNAIVSHDGSSTIPWSDAQRKALELFEGRPLTAVNR